MIQCCRLSTFHFPHNNSALPSNPDFLPTLPSPQTHGLLQHPCYQHHQHHHHSSPTHPQPAHLNGEVHPVPRVLGVVLRMMEVSGAKDALQVVLDLRVRGVVEAVGMVVGGWTVGWVQVPAQGSPGALGFCPAKVAGWPEVNELRVHKAR